MPFLGRSRELGQLRAALDQPTASTLLVSGQRGVGKSSLVRRSIDGSRALVHVCPPCPDAGQRAALANTLAGQDILSETTEAVTHPAPESSWMAIFASTLALAVPGGRPFLLVLDDAHRLSQARSRFERALNSTLERAREEGRTLHVILITHIDARTESDGDSTLVSLHLRLGPLPLRQASRMLPGKRPADLVRAYAVFGGLPAVLTRLEPSATLGINMRNTLFSRSGSLTDMPAAWLEKDFQNPIRYYAIADSMARGEADWRTVHAGVPDLTTSGQVAPYLQRLQRLGIIRIRRSLDARPRSRARRYAHSDPFLMFWLRFVQQWLRADSGPDASAYIKAHVLPRLDAHVQTAFPSMARQFMTYDAADLLGSNARECGSLWGSEVEVPVAGVLSGGAAFYGCCLWRDAVHESPLAQLDREVRMTRFGFGKQHRLRLIFSGRALPRRWQREVARRDDAFVIGVPDLVGATA